MITSSPRHDPQTALATHGKIIPDNVELEKKVLNTLTKTAMHI